jgi:hypothetical protein
LSARPGDLRIEAEVIIHQEQPMSTEPRIVNLEFALRSGRAGKIEFWRDNQNGTCTRISDGLTLTYEKYDALLPKKSEYQPKGLLL